jgi:hypothetical protein
MPQSNEMHLYILEECDELSLASVSGSVVNAIDVPTIL